jgi:hypothetical protein
VYATVKHQIWELNGEIHCIQRRTDMAKRASGCYVEADLALEHYASYYTATRNWEKYVEKYSTVERR